MAVAASAQPHASVNPDVQIRVLGPLEVDIDGESVSLPGGKVRRLLGALLAYPNEVVSTDRLAEVLWGSRPPETATNTLQTYVRHLRTSIDPARAPRGAGRVVVTRGSGYLLAVPPDHIDATRFVELIEHGRSLLATTPDRAARTLRSALAMWRGDPFHDFTFEPFAQAQIARLIEVRLAAIEHSIDAQLLLGEHHAALPELFRLVDQYPLRERFAGQLMVALYRSDRQAEALQVYRQLRGRLVDQLGIEPAPTLTHLEIGILEQRPDLNWRPAHPTPARAPTLLAAPDRPIESGTDIVQAARVAVTDRAWSDAVALFSQADSANGLHAADLNAFADALVWTQRPIDALVVRQRAHDAFVEADDLAGAATTAATLAIGYVARLRLALASGWLARANRVLEHQSPSPLHGFVDCAATIFHAAAGDDQQARAYAQRTFESGQVFGIPDLQAIGLAFGGYLRVRDGDVTGGLAMIDESMTWAASGQVTPELAALVFCRTMSTCYELADYRRASDWMESIADCFARTGITSFPGDCETHRIGVLIGRGAWTEAEHSARQACAHMEPIDLAHIGLALAEIGEIHLRRGELDQAADAFAAARDHGSPPQPGPARLQLARGDIPAATATISAALAEAGGNQLARTRLLLTQVEIALAANDLAIARDARNELTQLATLYTSHGIRAAAATAHGAVLSAEGDQAASIEQLQHALDHWRDANAPYDLARSRVLLAASLIHHGDLRRAHGEIQAARNTFSALGATLELTRLHQEVDRSPNRFPGHLS